MNILPPIFLYNATIAYVLLTSTAALVVIVTVGISSVRHLASARKQKLAGKFDPVCPLKR